LFEGSADPVLVTDEHGRFLAVNAAFSTFLGYSWDELRGRQAAEVYAPTDIDAIRRHFEQLRRDGRWSGELEVRRKDGGTVPVEVHATAIDAPTGPAYLGTWRDISERRAVERMQRDFLAMVSHELRNPLSTVKGFAQLMQRRGAYSERAVGGIVAQTDHLDRLVGDLLDVARLRAGRLEIQRERLDLVALAAANVEQARARTTAHTVRLDAPASPVVGRYDRGRLGQVFQNLLDNAIKYAPSGEIVVRVVPNDSEVLISVADQGPGIAREELPRLFDRFYRSDATADDATGFGIGLHVARSLVRAHGGRIWVESQPGRGSEFFFTLPRSATEDRDEP
jgi:PAS domain S-box-containing protein